MAREVPLIHPGVILLEDWLKPMNISQYALAIFEKGFTLIGQCQLAGSALQ